MTEPRWLIDPYADWVAAEGVRVEGGLALDLLAVETEPWARLDVPGAIVHLDARSDFLDCHLIDLPPGASTAPLKHIYEAATYVLEGSGSATIVAPDGELRQFEWGKGSFFSVPMNAEYRLHNASGMRRARLASVTNLPLMINLFRNEEFVFHNPLPFPERFGARDHFTGSGTFIRTREHRHMWETAFVPDLLSFDHLQNSPSRGTGSTNIMFVLADATLHAHMSEIPVGYYKKAHRHVDGFHIFQLSGHGYSLYWYEDGPVERVDWGYGTLHGPPLKIWHQHFNLSDEPARYMAVAMGSIRYPFTAENMASWKRLSEAHNEDQIEYEDEDPSIGRTFQEELARPPVATS